MSREQTRTPEAPTAPPRKGQFWPYDAEKQPKALQRLKDELKTRIPDALRFVGEPDRAAYEKAGAMEEYQERLDAIKGEREYLNRRLVCRVQRLGSVVQERGENLQPTVSVNGVYVSVPENKWCAIPVAAVEVFARCYYRVDSEHRPNPARETSEAATLEPGLVMVMFKRPEFRVEVWDTDTGSMSVIDPSDIQKNHTGGKSADEG